MENDSSKKITSVASKRLEVAETVDTQYSNEEEALWDEMAKKRAIREKETKRYIITLVAVFIIMCIILVLLLIWHKHRYNW